MKTDYDTYGKEVQADLWGVDAVLLDSLSFLLEKSKFAVARAGATYVSHQEKKFNPQGVTLLILLEESHYAAHTYPERGFIALSCFTCGTKCDPDIAINYMIQMLNPTEVFRKETIRGIR